MDDERIDLTARKELVIGIANERSLAWEALFLGSNFASGVTGEVLQVDAGYHIEGMVFH